MVKLNAYGHWCNVFRLEFVLISFLRLLLKNCYNLLEMKVWFLVKQKNCLTAVHHFLKS